MSIWYITRYVSDVLVVYDTANTRAESSLDDHNTVHLKVASRLI
jgi:hypothetical protein